MKKQILTLVLSALAACGLAQIPTLQKVGQSTALHVDGKPLILYSGELHNSTASSILYMTENSVFDQLQQLHLNSVIATISWEQFEQVEGKYDFTLTDWLIKEAENHHMKLVLLWFGTWKNPMMTYAPTWVKHDPKRFPRAVDEQGNEMEMISVYDKNILEADTKAYLALLQHLKDTDTNHTVVMIQLQNEPGLRGTKRDYSQEAEKAWKADVPANVINYLKANKGKLQPDLEKVWAAQGNPTSGNWETVFGRSDQNNQAEDPITDMTEHLFTAYGYANYLEQMAKAGKEVYPLPVFTNASVFGMNTRGRSLGNGCSIPEFFDIYRAAAPSLDILTPNSYMQQLDWIGQAFSWRGNPILIPESTLIAARGLYIIGEWDAIAFSPFGIDLTPDDAVTPQQQKQRNLLGEAYETMQAMNDVLTSHLGTDQMRGVYLYGGHEQDSLRMGDYELKFSPRKSFDIGALMAPANGGMQQSEPQTIEQGGALIVQTAEDEFYIVGYGFNADVRYVGGKSRYSGYDSIYEGQFEDGKFVPRRLLNGDERNVYAGYDHVKVLKVNLYHY